MAGDIRSVSETHPHLVDFSSFLDDLNKESARGAVLISSAYIEQQLGKIISSFLVEETSSENLLEGFNAPLGTFSARVTAAESLGLLLQYEHTELTTIRKIRNEFSHNHRASFSDQSISDMCQGLKYSITDLNVPPRDRFTTAAVSLILGLTNRQHYVLKNRLKRQFFPY